MDPHHSRIKPKFAQFRTYRFLGQAQPCPSILITQKIRPLSQWSAVTYPAIFSPPFPHIAPHCLQVSDKNGFGTGGTTASTTVLQSSDSSCYNTSNPTDVAWKFFFEPTGGLVQCESVRLWWYASTVNGCVSSSIFPNSGRPNSFHPSRHVPSCRTVNFYGTIPGGTSFAIPPGSLSTNNVTGTGFNWTVDIDSGTNILLIANDDSGIGAGGYVDYTIAPFVDSSCLNNNSPSSTAGNPAGAINPTSTSESSGNGRGNHSLS